MTLFCLFQGNVIRSWICLGSQTAAEQPIEVVLNRKMQLKWERGGRPGPDVETSEGFLDTS